MTRIFKSPTHYVPELHDVYHSEKVAFCTLAQLALENAPLDEMCDVIRFCGSVGLPTTFKELGGG
jgi:glycerol dehydrogenase